MEEKEKRSKRIVIKLKNKYRLVILNDDTFEEKLSLKLSRLNVFLVFGTLAIVLIVLTSLLIAFTPLREYIPGYASTSLRREAFQLNLKTDSIETQLAYQHKYLENIKRIMNGEDPEEIEIMDTSGVTSTIDLNTHISESDSLLRAYVENEDRFNLGKKTELSNFSFFAPVKGIISGNYDVKTDHFAVDVVAAKNSAIKSCLDGTVILSQWTTETGYVIIVQHRENLLSVYKHNSALLKKQGDAVRAGEAIAIIGNSGEQSTGPHLHFELWYEGIPVNPENYISF